MQTITNGILEATIKTFGAELWNLKDVKTGEDFMWKADANFWGKKAPILFPFIGGLKDGKYTYEGKDYSVAKHGFARDNEFEVVEKTEDKVVFRLSSNEELLASYPFEFDFYITYHFVGNELITDFKIVNKGTNKMYFNLGGHPAFATPTSEEVRLEDYYLEYEKAEKSDTFVLDGVLLSRETKKYLDGNRINITKDIFNDDAIVFEKQESKVVTLKNTKNSRYVRVEYQGFPIIAFWSAPEAEFVCIEPWCGVNDFVDASGKIEEKYAVENLEAGKEFNRTIKIQVGL